MNHKIKTKKNVRTWQSLLRQVCDYEVNGIKVINIIDNSIKVKILELSREELTHSVWNNMKHRCHSPRCKYYKDYGGRGITVCDRWMKSFKLFIEDMGHPKEGHSLERVDNSLGYSKENCRWATSKEQQRNRRSSIYFTYEGEKKCLSEWAEIYKISPATLRKRINKWGIYDALNRPIDEKKKMASDLGKIARWGNVRLD